MDINLYIFLFKSTQCPYYCFTEGSTCRLITTTQCENFSIQATYSFVDCTLGQITLKNDQFSSYSFSHGNSLIRSNESPFNYLDHGEFLYDLRTIPIVSSPRQLEAFLIELHHSFAIYLKELMPQSLKVEADNMYLNFFEMYKIPLIGSFLEVTAHEYETRLGKSSPAFPPYKLFVLTHENPEKLQILALGPSNIEPTKPHIYKSLKNCSDDFNLILQEVHSAMLNKFQLSI